MALRKGLTNIEIQSLLDDSDNEDNLEDISDEEFFPNALSEDESNDDSFDDDHDVLQESNFENDMQTKYLVAKSGDKWYRTNISSAGRLSSINVITTKPGPTVYASARMTVNPSSAFNLIFDNEMTKTLLYETNREGRRV